MTLLKLMPVPGCLRPNEANAVRAELYSRVRDARMETAADEARLAERVRRGLAVQARVREPTVPRCRALVVVR